MAGRKKLKQELKKNKVHHSMVIPYVSYAIVEVCDHKGYDDILCIICRYNTIV
jgi:hypothetical protein